MARVHFQQKSKHSSWVINNSYSNLITGRPGPSASKVLLDWAGLDYSPEELYAKTTALQVFPISFTTYEGNKVDKS
jgi:hypothetical protein